jgi:hypothetical protein
VWFSKVKRLILFLNEKSYLVTVGEERKVQKNNEKYYEVGVGKG